MAGLAVQPPTFPPRLTKYPGLHGGGGARRVHMGEPGDVHGWLVWCMYVCMRSGFVDGETRFLDPGTQVPLEIRAHPT